MERMMMMMILDNSKIVVPRLARKAILNKLHIPHSGMMKTRRIATEQFSWPGMGQQIA